eukprot:TRINITY_DN12187_c1_g1_i3.p1 TRINITY_DN12187_c1_g1~~TRINITY_DN12187_c1_g1_i3.p1  ORF type:complete len:102 (+),score=7.17 TRINITY_DN12187_c1_g1_i3:697-1002(+)
MSCKRCVFTARGWQVKVLRMMHFGPLASCSDFLFLILAYYPKGFSVNCKHCCHQALPERIVELVFELLLECKEHLLTSLLRKHRPVPMIHRGSLSLDPFRD